MNDGLYTLTQVEADRIAMSVPRAVADPLALHLERIASDLGRLRRRICEDEYGLHLVDRIGASVETLDAITRPRAADIYQANRAFGVAEDEAAEAALEDVDARRRDIRALLGERAA